MPRFRSAHFRASGAASCVASALSMKRSSPQPERSTPSSIAAPVSTAANDGTVHPQRSSPRPRPVPSHRPQGQFTSVGESAASKDRSHVFMLSNKIAIPGVIDDRGQPTLFNKWLKSTSLGLYKLQPRRVVDGTGLISIVEGPLREPARFGIFPTCGKVIIQNRSAG